MQWAINEAEKRFEAEKTRLDSAIARKFAELEELTAKVKQQETRLQNFQAKDPQLSHLYCIKRGETDGEYAECFHVRAARFVISLFHQDAN